jgi:hypothetical protein
MAMHTETTPSRREPDDAFDRLGPLAAIGVAVLSVLYAVAYLVITPAAQRDGDAGAFFRSYLAHPTGLRIASLCLGLSGILSGVAVVALVRRVEHHGPTAARWAATLGVGAGLATSLHGFGDLFAVDKLAHRFESGDSTTRSAVVLAQGLPSAVDPRGLATFGVAGMVAATLGMLLRREHGRLGPLGMVLGADLVALFVATAVRIDPLVLVTGGLASLALGPVWWIGVGRLLRRAPAPVPVASDRTGSRNASGWIAPEALSGT